jgi:hypothetical protein
VKYSLLEKKKLIRIKRTEKRAYTVLEHSFPPQFGHHVKS